MVKKNTGVRAGHTLVRVLIDQGGTSQVQVTSESTSPTSAILSALDRALASYQNDIEVETQNWLTKWSELTNVFKNALGLLPAGRSMADTARTKEQVIERVKAVEKREVDLAKREAEHAVQETMLWEERVAFNTLKSAGDTITGESVTLTSDGATVRVIVNGVLREYQETIVIQADGNNMPADGVLQSLTRIVNVYSLDAATNMADHVLAARLLEHVDRLREMNAEIQNAGDALTNDPELEAHADDSDGPADDAEPIVGTAPLTGTEVKELIRKRDRNLAGT